ncbi:MAG: hypothetical protein LBU79_09725, partial [Planctomycetota bacterium]|nr:hypothetical protein [Planctomycetota bacterium]
MAGAAGLAGGAGAFSTGLARVAGADAERGWLTLGEAGRGASVGCVRDRDTAGGSTGVAGWTGAAGVASATTGRGGGADGVSEGGGATGSLWDRVGDSTGVAGWTGAAGVSSATTGRDGGADGVPEG